MSLPVFTSHPNNLQVDVFDNVTLICEASGFNIYTITWKRLFSRFPITATETITKTGDMVTNTLHITRTNGYYAGQYYCIAGNSAGQVSSKVAKLYVQGNM